MLACKHLGADDFRSTRDPLVSQLVGQGVRGWSTTPGEGGAAVYMVVEGIWGYTSAGATTLAVELEEVLGTEKMRSKISKLERAGCRERHLFLYVRPQAFSFPVFDTLAFGGALPDELPRLPEGLDVVWLLSGWAAGGVVRAVAGKGWVRSMLRSDGALQEPRHDR